jgi:hypothetical protein
MAGIHTAISHRRHAAARGDGAHASSGTRLFSPTSFWNQPLESGAPLDPSSSALVSELGREVQAVAARKSGPYMATTEYSTPLYTVPAGQPSVHVTLDTYTPSSLQAAFAAVPLPRGAKPAAGTDGHLTVWQPSTDRLWEFWRLSHKADGWHAAWGGAIQHVSESPGYYTRDSWPGAAPYWGASATSLPIIGGTILLRDLAAGHIDHAIALGLPQLRANAYSWPAERSDGESTSPTAIPEGARFRLDPRLDLASLNLPPIVREVAEAAQRYGMVVRDQSGTVALYAEDPSPLGLPWGSNPYARLIGAPYVSGDQYQLWSRFPWGHLQLLKLELHPRAR